MPAIDPAQALTLAAEGCWLAVAFLLGIGFERVLSRRRVSRGPLLCDCTRGRCALWNGEPMSGACRCP